MSIKAQVPARSAALSRRITSPALLIALGFIAAADASAQSSRVEFGVFGGFERYTFGDPDQTGLESVTLLSTPFGIRVPVGSRIALEAGGAFAQGKIVRADGSEASLSGLTDTEVRLSVTLGRDLLVLSGAALLPTGKSKQDAEEAQVAGIIAADVLPFRISNWGSGGGADVSAALAVPLGGVGLGLRVGYQMAREFEPLEETEFAYRPGDQIYGRVAIDGNVGAGKMALSATLQHFNDDEFDGRNLYRSGDRIQVLGSYAFPAGFSGSGVAYAGVLHRASGTFITDDQELPSQNLILVGTGFRLPLGGAMLVPAADLRVFRTSDGLGQGYVTTIGAALELPLGGAQLVPTARGRFGNLVVSEGNESGVTGFDVGIGLRFGGSRP